MPGVQFHHIEMLSDKLPMCWYYLPEAWGTGIETTLPFFYTVEVIYMNY